MAQQVSLVKRSAEEGELLHILKVDFFVHKITMVFDLKCWDKGALHSCVPVQRSTEVANLREVISLLHW